MRARRRQLPRRILTTGLAALLTTTGALTVTGQPAAALTTFVQPTEVTWTDKAEPTRSFPAENGAVPVGTWQDSTSAKHRSRAYSTFDLTPYRGKDVIRAYGVTGESSVTDCNRAREIEIWRTDTPSQAPTWATAPQVHEKAGDVFSPPACPARYLELDLTETVRQAVADGRDSLTLMARIAGDHEENKHFSRWITPLGISIEANAAPDVPSGQTVAGLACADGRLIGTTQPVLSAEVTDPDKVEWAAGDQVTATFAWWPVDQPTERTEWTSYSSSAPRRFTYTVPAGGMVHGGTYAFSVRAADQHASSDWSPECRFTVDTEVPAAPTVTSTDYPAYPAQPTSHGAQIPGRFTISANGSQDVVRYQYWGFDGTGQVDADGPGGNATFTYTPKRAGYHRIEVYSVDRTGNTSPRTTYEFLVRETAPQVVDGNPEGRLGQPRTFTFNPSMADVTEYVWRLDEGAEQTVAADADGTSTVTVTPTGTRHTLHVRSRTRDGALSADAAHTIWVRTAPLVTSADWPFDGTPGAPAGTEGTFVFRPAMDDVAEYVYSFDWGEQQTVAAGADGTATVSYTPSDASHHTIQVFSRTTSGVESEVTEEAFFAASVAPTVVSEVYPQNQTGGGPGMPGTFTFTPHPGTSGVTSFVYMFRDEPERTVTAGADGTATVTWTPAELNSEYGGWMEVRVRAVTATGQTTDAAYYSFRVDPKSPLITSDVFGWQGGAVVGQTGDFVFTAQLPETTEFVYSFDGGPEQTVAAGADGTARVSWTAPSAYGHDLTVRSRTASGTVSGYAYYNIWIDWS